MPNFYQLASVFSIMFSTSILAEGWYKPLPKRPHNIKTCLGLTKVIKTSQIEFAKGEIDFEIPASQIELAQKTLKKDFINETLFIIPNNDGEAKRAIEILRAIGAPHLQESKQNWGATLEKEPLEIDSLKNRGIKRVVVFEIPGIEIERSLQNNGIEVIPVDHHTYKDLDRRQPDSSLEQLMKLVGWPASKIDHALAVNDRGYIAGLKKLSLTDNQIREIRTYDLVAQGKSRTEVERQIELAEKIIPKLAQRNGIYFLDRSGFDGGILKQELAIRSPNGLVNIFEISRGSLGFSGNPEITKRLIGFDFETLGYPKGTYAQYGGGDESASMFFGFKPTNPPHGETDLIPYRVRNVIERVLEGTYTPENPKMDSGFQFLSQKHNRIIFNQTEVNADVLKNRNMLPRGSALITESGNLAKSGITAIVHAATGSMTRSGGAFEPTLESVGDSIGNSITLAKENGHKRIAIPFVGGKIFISRIGTTPEELSEKIIRSALKNASGIEVRFVLFSNEERDLFNKILEKVKRDYGKINAEVLQGSLTDYKLHGASAIINAANMEVKFGGGLSGAIAAATGNASQIDAEANVLIWNFIRDATNRTKKN